MSLPTRGGWIEIPQKSIQCFQVKRPSPHGEGGLKFTAKLFPMFPGEVPPLMGRVD